MSTVTIPIEFELTPRSRAVMAALSRVLDPHFVAPEEPAEQADSSSTAQALSAPVAPGAYWPEQEAWYAGLQMTPGGRFWHLLVPKAHIETLRDVEWGRHGTSIDGAVDVYDGLANTQAKVDAGLELAERVQALGEGLYLPSRAEALLMFASLKDQIGEGILWTSTQCSAYGAWFQGFNGGGQNTDFKDCEFRAVPVRRLFL